MLLGTSQGMQKYFVKFIFLWQIYNNYTPSPDQLFSQLPSNYKIKHFTYSSWVSHISNLTISLGPQFSVLPIERSYPYGDHPQGEAPSNTLLILKDALAGRILAHYHGSTFFWAQISSTESVYVLVCNHMGVPHATQVKSGLYATFRKQNICKIFKLTHYYESMPTLALACGIQGNSLLIPSHSGHTQAPSHVRSSPSCSLLQKCSPPMPLPRFYTALKPSLI